MRKTKEKAMKALATLLCAAMMLAMVACFGPKTIQEAFETPGVQEEMQKICDDFKRENPDLVRDMTFEFKDNQIIFKAYCLQNFEPLKPAEVTMLDDEYVKIMSAEAEDLREAFDIEGEIRIGFYMYNADGSVFYSKDMNFY